MTDPATPPGPNPEPPSVEALQREIAHLREQLARKTTEATIYREAVYDMVRDKVSYTPMTEEEARELMKTPPGGESIPDIIAEYERRLGG
jgi:hypothetical protein